MKLYSVTDVWICMMCDDLMMVIIVVCMNKERYMKENWWKLYDGSVAR